MRDRPVGELVVVIFTVAIAVSLVVAVAGVVVVRIVYPRTDISVPAASIGTLLSALGGYVLGVNRRRD